MESIAEIRKLLDRFYLGETTLEEEKWLQDYFSSTTVPEELLPDRELVQTFGSSNDSIGVPHDLNRKILNTIDREEQKELRTRRISLFSLSGLAAGLLVMIAVYLFFLRTDEPALLAGNGWPDTYEDPMEAYEEAKRTLAYVSVKLNHGTSELNHVQRVSKTTTDPLKSLSKINKGTRELNLLGQLQRIREIERQ
ncbi:MAG: hypothetical protein KAT15_11430 [Bacteroidales bacterium]|nr:hypothetical protein [Bacteroidales bacterium]